MKSYPTLLRPASYKCLKEARYQTKNIKSFTPCVDEIKWLALIKVEASRFLIKKYEALLRNL